MYLKAVSRINDFYQFPYKVLCLIINNLNESRRNLINQPPGLRLIKTLLIKNGVRLKFQIKNSRATYIATISDVISDYNFIASCEKVSLIEIGYFSKVEEYKRMQSLSNNTLNKISILNSLFQRIKLRKKISDNSINPDEFHYNFVDIQTNTNLQRYVHLLIASSKHIFQVPYEDLILDSNLLDEIYPPDLLKIGYELCAKDIQENRTPIYCF